MWSSDVVNNPKIRLKHLKERIAYLHKQNQATACLEERRKLQAELEQVYTYDNMYWHQRGKVDWAKDGDRNT